MLGKPLLAAIPLFVALLPLAIPAQTQARGALPERILLTWTGDPARSQAVTWRTALPIQKPRAQLVPAPAGPEGFEAATTHPAKSRTVTLLDESTVHYHTVAFKGLEPATRYSYRVGSNERWSEWNDFTTASTQPVDFSFIYFGDAQNGLASLWPRVFRAAFMEAPRAAFALFAGDLVDLGLRDEQWGALFESAGWALRSLPVVATPGNHEYFALERGGPRALPELWKAQFAYPANGVPGLEGTNYFIDYQDLRVISLDSNLRIDDQAAWLGKTLADNPARWTVATFHHPIYSTAVKRDNSRIRQVWQPLFQAHGVDLVLQGHDHVYGRQVDPPPQGSLTGSAGTVYVVSVGGPKMYRAHPETTRPMVRVAENTQLYQVICLSSNRLDYRAFSADGALYDAFTLEKDPRGFKRLHDRIPALPERRRQPEEAHDG